MQASKEKLVKTLASVIKKRRIKTKKSVYQIAAESSIDNSTWRKIEKAQYNDIKLSNLWKIAEGLDVNIEELMKELRLKLGENFSIIEDE